MIAYKKELLFYREHLVHNLLAFWSRSYDPVHGGIFTCFNNTGEQLVNRDKYVWSQGRMAWVYSRIVQDIDQGLLPELEKSEYLEKARRTCCFLRDHAILPPADGVCAYLLTEEGHKKESIPGKGYYTSFFVDCFVILGFCEYALACKDEEFLTLALSLYDRCTALLAQGKIVTEPYPIAEGFVSHAVDMILSCTSNHLWRALTAVGHPRAQEINEKSLAHVTRILNVFYWEDFGVIQELKPLSPQLEDTFSARHIMPGHALESMWFCQHILAQNHLPADKKIFTVSANSLSLGWDKQYGGLLRCVDVTGGPPRGRRLAGDPYESLMADTWDSKLWWPHSESLYMTLLCYTLTQDPLFEEYYNKTAAYVKEKFINPNKDVGEWIQILDRQGRPMEKVVALPVKDPFHILRNVLLLIELLSEEIV